MAIIAVGDVTPRTLAAMIREQFSSTTSEDASVQPKLLTDMFSQPMKNTPSLRDSWLRTPAATQFPLFVISKDPGAVWTTLNIHYRFADIAAGVAASNRMLERKKAAISPLLTTVVIFRLEELKEDDASKVLEVDVTASRLTRTMKYFRITVNCKHGDELVALENVLAVLERIKRFGVPGNHGNAICTQFVKQTLRLNKCLKRPLMQLMHAVTRTC
jgi:hypothetical protein